MYTASLYQYSSPHLGKKSIVYLTTEGVDLRSRRLTWRLLGAKFDGRDI